MNNSPHPLFVRFIIGFLALLALFAVLIMQAEG